MSATEASTQYNSKQLSPHKSARRPLVRCSALLGFAPRSCTLRAQRMKTLRVVENLHEQKMDMLPKTTWYRRGAASSAYQSAVCSVAASHTIFGTECSKLWPYQTKCFDTVPRGPRRLPKNRQSSCNADITGSLHPLHSITKLDGWPLPLLGQVVKVRCRRYLVEGVEPAREPDWEQTLVDLSCLEDDAQGEHLAVLWEREVDAHICSKQTGGISPARVSTRRTSSPLTSTRFAGIS